MLICHLDAVTLRHIASIYIRSHTNVDTRTVACTAYVYSYKIGLQTFTDLGTKTQDVRSQCATALLLASRQNSDGVGIQSIERVAQVSPGFGSLMRRIQSAF